MFKRVHAIILAVCILAVVIGAGTYIALKKSKSPVSADQETKQTVKDKTADVVQNEKLYSLNLNIDRIERGMYAGVNKTDKLDQNGFVNDWTDQTSFKLPSNKEKQVKISNWRGEEDCSAKVNLAFDENNLYMQVIVKDDTQFDIAGETMNQGDSIQVAFSKDGLAYGSEYGFSYGKGTPGKFCWSKGNAQLGVDSIKLQVNRDEGTKETTYDVTIPWLASLPKLSEQIIPFSLIINDNDGSEKKGFLQWTPGIGDGTKDATALGALVLLPSALDSIDARLPALTDLMAKCKAKKIPTDYETVNYTVIKKFIQYGKDDIVSNELYRAAYVVIEMEKFYKEAETNLVAYLSQEKIAFEVPRYITQRPKINGFSFVGPTKTSSSDKTEERPIFFYGYGHFAQAQADIPEFSDLGTNAIQMEIGPDSVVFEPTEGSGKDFSIDTTALKNSVLDVLKSAEEHNVGVSMLLSPHYFPNWAKEKWPELVNTNGGFIKFNINAPKAREIIKAYLEAVIPLIKDYKSLHSVVLSNEPEYKTKVDSFAVKPWAEFLKNKYGTINKLNEIYKSKYNNFEEVKMPEGSQTTTLYYDWVCFNNEYFSEWHKWMAGIIKGLAPDLPIHTKFMANVDGATSYGVDPEDFSSFCDINGDDNWNYIGHGITGYVKENRYYDLQASLKVAPIFNTETHIVEDRNTNFGPIQAKHVETALWQGALHGRTGSTIWTWERTDNPDADFWGGILSRPDVIKTVGKLNLDLNRLSNEVTALQNIAPQAAILYSLPSLVYSEQYLNTLDKAYEKFMFNGQRVGFVSEKQMQKGDLSKYKLLVVPQATNVTSSTLQAIKNFIDAGGKVVIIGKDCLRSDENNQPLNAADRNYILSKAEVVDGAADAVTLNQAILNNLNSLGLMKVLLKDKETGLLVSNVEWLSTEFNGKLLIDIANYSTKTDSIKITVEVNGKSVGMMKELINGGEADASNLTVVSNKPYLFSVDK